MNILKTFAQSFLALLARKIITKYQPLIIGITGSVGKTSAKEAVFCVVSQKMKTRRSKKNFNNEFGLPLTIIGADSPGKNIFLWLGACFQGLLLIFGGFKQIYPQALVLEYGVDHPDDMDFLLSIARPHISIITSISVSHLEFFKTREALAQEKGKLAEILKPQDILIVNADDPLALDQIKKTQAKVISYGLTNNAEIKIQNIQEDLEDNKYQTGFSVSAPDRETSSYKIKAIGESHLSAVAAGMATAYALKIEDNSIKNGFKLYKPAPGRLNLIAGIKRSVIIDDTYNASPLSVTVALNLLQRMPRAVKIAVLGDMLELGDISEASHEEVGRLAAKLKLTGLITVGSKARLIAKAAKQSGMADSQIFSFDSWGQALKPVQDLIPEKAAILIKGSQGMRLEKLTKELMAEPMKANELLCRQYGKWLIT